MTTIRTQFEPEVAPPGRRSVRQNVWGNVNAYVSGRFWKTLGPAYSVGIDEAVEEWLNPKEEDPSYAPKED